MPEFESWSYTEARSELWPEASFTDEHKAGQRPPDDDRFPINAEIANLIAATGNSPKLRSPIKPLAQGQTIDIMVGTGFEEFCPYKEVRAHWIPFALQVARFEAERHRKRTATDGEIIRDMRKALRAIDAFCAHDDHALARVARPVFGSWNTEPAGGRWPENEVEAAFPERFANAEEERLLRDPLSVSRAASAKAKAIAARQMIAENLAAVRREQREFIVP